MKRRVKNIIKVLIIAAILTLLDAKSCFADVAMPPYGGSRGSGSASESEDTIDLMYPIIIGIGMIISIALIAIFIKYINSINKNENLKVNDDSDNEKGE